MQAWAKATAGMQAAGDATARAAKQTKLKGEIMLLNQKMEKAKKEFGPLVYDAMVQSINGPEVRAQPLAPPRVGAPRTVASSPSKGYA